MSLASILMLCAVIGPLAWLAVREHRMERARRRVLLADCRELFESHELTHGGDGFPRIAGIRRTRRCDVRLISDGMTIRRLPQLWLQVTELAPLKDVSGLSVLVRPSGYEFFSLTTGFHHIIEAPPSFPRELIVRGETAMSVETLERLAGPMAIILSDPCVKEISVTCRGLRIIRQADEGRRGDYLLLRQAAFSGAVVQAKTLAGALDGIDALRTALEAPSRTELSRA